MPHGSMTRRRCFVFIPHTSHMHTISQTSQRNEAERRSSRGDVADANDLAETTLSSPWVVSNFFQSRFSSTTVIRVGLTKVLISNDLDEIRPRAQVPIGDCR